MRKLIKLNSRIKDYKIQLKRSTKKWYVSRIVNKNLKRAHKLMFKKHFCIKPSHCKMKSLIIINKIIKVKLKLFNKLLMLIKYQTKNNKNQFKKSNKFKSKIKIIFQLQKEKTRVYNKMRFQNL